MTDAQRNAVTRLEFAGYRVVGARGRSVVLAFSGSRRTKLGNPHPKVQSVNRRTGDTWRA